MKFSHLHNHTQFSLLDGASPIKKLYSKAVEDGMPALAITDHGNMFGVFHFVAEAAKHTNEDGSLKVKPIVGCEFYVVEDRHKRQFTREERDVRYHQVLLAKNDVGYRNLVKLCSLGYMEGMYSKYPRIDRSLIEQYHEGLIATTCCLAAEVPRAIIRKGEEEAEEVFKWWLDLFGDDYYIELQRHGIPEQDEVNAVLQKWSVKYNVPMIATNDSHYVDRQDANAHDILLCINTAEKQATPKAKDFSDEEGSMRGTRFAFYNDEFFFKTQAEMGKVFRDIPEALDNTNAIIDKVEVLDLKKDILLPHFQLPAGFTDQDAYLHHLTMEGAKARYKDITPDIQERLDFELFTIRTMGFAGYFLIVADFINHGKDIGVFVGPGRGSAAGSAVAYCIGITNIDPIHYNLLFERFLNPDRKSMPDIDTDFDDEGRQKVIEYVVDKYGKNQVAQLITFGTMAAKMSIKDVGRVLDLPLAEANMLAKYVPERPGINLNRLMFAPLKGEGSLAEKENLSPDEMTNIQQLRKIMQGDDLQAKVIQEAVKLEGSVRNTGIHAAGIIIAPSDLTDLLPVAVAKDSELLVTQYEGEIIESAGVIKMDFLGLKTLSILKTALKHIKLNHHRDIDLDILALEDEPTFGLYQRGETNGTFQFESAGMQKYLKELKPDKFEDLIAMNALYRPGPMDYIPTYIARKQGREKITYDLPEMEEILKETYGVTVYQEQVMLLSQRLANFTKGDADTLRKAMGKKQKAVLDKMKSKFMEGCVANGHPDKVCEKIWTDWEAFAQYAFNKSHSTCYALVAYQTAYLKANYPAEYMCAVLTHNQNNLDKVSFFMDECRRMEIMVLGPDINESGVSFTVNEKGEIRFGLAAIKGVGEAAVQEIIQQREQDGAFQTFFDLVRRVNLRTVNKKTMESLVLAGAFDTFGLKRAQYFTQQKNDQLNVLEHAIKYGGTYQQGSQQEQATLFGDAVEVEIAEPTVPDVPEWNSVDKLKQEYDVCGIYLSGHPLDEHRLEVEAFRTCSIADMHQFVGRTISLIGLVGSSQTRTTKTGDKFSIFTLEDYSGNLECMLFKEMYVKFKHYVEDPGYIIHVKGNCQPGYRDKEKIEVRVQEVELLSETRAKRSIKVRLKMPLAKVDTKQIVDLKAILDAHPGNDQLAMEVYHEQMQVPLRSVNGLVQVDKGLIKALGRFGEVQLAVG